MKFNRQSTIDWLETNRNNGFFIGFPENDIDFKKMKDEELKFYFYEWFMPDRENQ